MASIAELLERARAMSHKTSTEGGQGCAVAIPTPLVTVHPNCGPENDGYISKYLGIDKYGNTIYYNQEQDTFISLMAELKSCVLIGAAGTGKTSTMNGGLANAPLMPMRDTGGHRHLFTGVPSVLLLSYTNRAVQNLKKAVPENLKKHCMTIHKALEYEPVYSEIWDAEAQSMKTTMRFEPTRCASNPITSDIQMVVIDEASMPSVELYAKLLEALPHRPAMVFLGDINQLPPVFGRAILGFKMRTLPVVELTRVYRTALLSPILALATHMRAGGETTYNDITATETKEGKLTVVPWQKKITADAALLNAAQVMARQLDKGAYNPLEDIILIPFNKAFGTVDFNKILATHYARSRGATVYEIITGVSKAYYSVGDRVMYEKADGTVTDIHVNAKYAGRKPHHASQHLTYEGVYTDSSEAETESQESWDIDSFNIDAAITALGGDDSDETFRAASHIVEITMDDGDIVKVDNAGDFNKLTLGYTITVHKAQGSEWRKVYFITHHSHATMHQRELLYTAVTRAREDLVVFCEKDTFVKGVRSQKIKGTTLAEKIDSFTDKLESLPNELMWAVTSSKY